MKSPMIDLSHDIEDGMTTCPNIPSPEVGTYLSREVSAKHYEKGTSFHIGRVAMVVNTGTYLDAPYHRYADGVDIAHLPLEQIAGVPGLVIHASHVTEIGPEYFRDQPIKGRAVLIHTGWDRHWRTDHYGKDHPHLTETAANFLRDEGATLVGIDSMNIDSTETGERPVHSILLKAGIPVVEHLCELHRLPREHFLFFAVPAKVKGVGSFPIRAFAITQEE